MLGGTWQIGLIGRQRGGRGVGLRGTGTMTGTTTDRLCLRRDEGKAAGALEGAGIATLVGVGAGAKVGVARGAGRGAEVGRGVGAGAPFRDGLTVGEGNTIRTDHRQEGEVVTEVEEGEEAGSRGHRKSIEGDAGRLHHHVSLIRPPFSSYEAP